MIKGKRGFEVEFIAWTIFGIVMLIIIISVIIVLKNKGLSGIDFLKDLLKFKSP